MTTSHNCEIGFYVHFRCFCDGAVCVWCVCAPCLWCQSRWAHSFLHQPYKWSFRHSALVTVFRGWRAFTAHFHVTALRNSYEINEIKVIFLFVLCLFYLGLFLFAFLFYKLFYYYQVFDCISASFVDVFSIRTFHITSHSSFHSLILRAPKAFSHRQRSTK